MRQVSLPMVFIVVPLPLARIRAHVYRRKTVVFAAHWNFPARANFAYQIIAGKRVHCRHGYGRTYLSEVRAAELHRQIYAPIGIPMITEMILLHLFDISEVEKKKPANRGCLFAIAAFRQPYFPVGINSAVRHVRQNAFIANGAATTTTTTTTVTAIVTVVTVIIDVARTELLDRLPPLSRGERACVRRIRVCPMVVGGYLRWSYRAGLSQVEIRATDFHDPKIRKCKYERNRRKTNIARHRWR